MAKLFYKYDEENKELLAILDELRASLYPLESAYGSKVNLEFRKIGENEVSSCRKVDKKWVVSYSKLKFAGRGILYALSGKEGEIRSDFESAGLWFDVSRNAVMQLGFLRGRLAKAFLLGADTVVLYVEDVYELKDEPYFGYLRGRYTLEEMKKFAEWAKIYGIELIPAIQTLGHMEQLLKWDPYGYVKDIENVLLADSEDTYKLIEKMLDFWQEALNPKRIHIGMDEAHGMGRGAYFDKHGKVDRFEIFTKHLNRVASMVKNRGIKPMMWSDMYYRMGNPTHDYFCTETVIPESAKKGIPDNVEMWYWDYYSTEVDFYEKMLDINSSLCSDTGVACGIWSWTRSWYDHKQTVATLEPCLEACRNKGVKKLLFTMWHDNGGVCYIDSVLAGMVWTFNKVYNCEFDAELFKALSRGGNYYDVITAAKIEDYQYGGDLHFGIKSIGTPCMLWDDPILGILWKNEKLVNPDFVKIVTANYREVISKLKRKKREELQHAVLLAEVLLLKVEMKDKLDRAYVEKDIKTLTQIAKKDLPKLINKFKVLSMSFGIMWDTYYKHYGYEVIQIRNAGQIARLEELHRRILQYLFSDYYEIPELLETVPYPVADSYGHYRFFATACGNI